MIYHKKTNALMALLLQCCFLGLANTENDSIPNPKGEVLVNTSSFDHPAIRTRSFEELDNIENEDQNFHFSKKEGEFTPTYLANNFKLAAETNEDLQAAKNTFATLEDTNNFVDSLEPTDLVSLPVGVKKTVGNVAYVLGISSAEFTPQYTELTAFVRAILPQLDAEGNQREIFFGATNVRLSHKGGLLGEANLVLLGDVPISIQGGNGLIVLKGGFDMETGNVTNLSYVTIDCDGFKEFTLMAQVQFSRSMLEPIKEDYTVDDSLMPDGNKKRVAGDFRITVDDWNDVLAKVDLPKFQMTSFRGTVFEVNNAIVDFSDIRNAENIRFPDNYDQYLIPGQPEAWRGVYVQSLEVALPEQFKRRNSDERIKFKALDFLIDGMGVSGKFSVDDILPLSEGEASGWQFSVDHIQADIAANSLIGAGFDGKIVLPVSKEVSGSGDGNSALGYSAIINPVDNEYILTTESVKDLNFDFWKAKATIAENSYIELKVKDKKFRPKAVLNGSLLIDTKEAGTTGDGVVNFPGVKFQELQLQTVKPKITAEYFGYTGKVAVAGFPVTLDDINIKSGDEEATLSFNVNINLMKNKINGEAGLGVVGKMENSDGLERWNYDRLKMDEINVNADLGAMVFDGQLALMENDEVYGNGFRGGVRAKFKGLGETTITSNAIFGKKDFRYWYVDGLVDNLNIQTGTPFKIKGFGGGAYYRMKKIPSASAAAPSGMNYQPNSSAGLGVKASLLYANAANSRVFNGSAAFEIAFNSNYGVDRISIYGDGHIMQDFNIPNPKDLMSDNLRAVVDKESGIAQNMLNARKDADLLGVSKEVYPDNVKGESGIHAYTAIDYDFNSDALHGVFETYIDVAGGGFRGREAGNKAGTAVVHFARDKWYIHLGTPTNRLGVTLGIGPAKMNTGAYLMVGDNIPELPAPPQNVLKELGADAQKLYANREESTLRTGKGFAFGSNFSVDTGDITFLIFYANFQADAGFDVMIKDYGQAACAGSGQIGINGWYTNGQGYASLQGDLGINVNLLFTKKKVSILSGGAAVLLQTKLPNPSWFRGYVRGHFEVLGGAVKGDYNFKIELGQQCDMINGGALDGLQIIADITPGEDAKDVDIFSVPQVGFNMKINEPFEFIDDEGVKKEYRVKLDEFQILNKGREIAGKKEWNNGKDLISFTGEDVLPETTPLELKVSVSFEELQNGNWSTLYHEGKPAKESKNLRFTTGKDPGTIPLSQIVYSYPVVDQQYFHSKEYKNGYIKLKQGRPNLFKKGIGNEYKANFMQDGAGSSTEISYDAGQKLITFDIPNMQPDTDYTLVLKSIPQKADYGANVLQAYAKNKIGDNSTVETRDNTLKETVTSSEEMEMLTYSFHTSEYETFRDKLEAKQLQSPIVDIISGGVHALQAVTDATEPFELLELEGNPMTSSKPLIVAEATLNDTYYISEIFPKIYKGYPLGGRFKVNRNTDLLGIPPKKAVQPMAWYVSYLAENRSSVLLSTRLPLRYDLAVYYKRDLMDIRHKIANAYADGSSGREDYSYILGGTFPPIRQGDYNSMIRYVLPGDKTGTSGEIKFQKPY